MDHKEQHHEHHRKEREQLKHDHKVHEHQGEEKLRTIHPKWFLVGGVILIVVAVLSWTLFLQ